MSLNSVPPVPAITSGATATMATPAKDAKIALFILNNFINNSKKLLVILIGYLQFTDRCSIPEQGELSKFKSSRQSAKDRKIVGPFD
jgi:hypothetical protein